MMRRPSARFFATSGSYPGSVFSTSDGMPHSPSGNGKIAGPDWTFTTGEHGGDEPDNMPQAITATDPAGALGGLCPAYPARQDSGPAPLFRDGRRPAARLRNLSVWSLFPHDQRKEQRNEPRIPAHDRPPAAAG